MKKWILTLMTAFFLAMVIVEIGAVAQVSAATEKTGTTSDGFSYKILSEDGTVEITKYTGKKKKLVFPSKIEGRKVTQIGDFVIKNNKYVVSIEVPDSVKKIEDEAFSQSKKLKTIKLGKNVEQLGKNDFLYGGGKVESIEVSSENKTYYSIDGVLFKREKNERILVQYPCEKKDAVYQVPEDTTKIKMEGICWNDIETLMIPASVKELVCGEDRWYLYIIEWKSCKEIIVDENNPNFYSEDGVLFDSKHCLLWYPLKKSDVHYDIPDGTVRVEDGAFMWNQYIEEVIMPDSVEQIGNSAFFNCSNLKSVDTAAGMGEDAFDGCKKLENLTLREGVDGLATWALGSTKVTDIVLPMSVWILEPNATTTSELKTLTIPNKDCIIQGKQGTINKTIIYGYADSTAEAYAKKWGYQFKLIGAEETPGEDLSKGTITKETIKLSKTSYTYDGKTKKPEVVVKDKFGNKIDKYNYKVSYKNNTNVGIATVKIQLMYNYDGTIKTTFTIKPPKSNITKLTATENGFKMQWNGVKASQIDGYEIQYAVSKGFETDSTQKIFINQSKTAKKNINNLESEKTYYVRICSYKAVSKDGSTERLYSKWSDVKKIKTL